MEKPNRTVRTQGLAAQAGARAHLPVEDILRTIRLRSVQAIGAGLSRRDWSATESAYNELRDSLDRLIQQMSSR